MGATCAVGASIRAIAADGTVTCQTDTFGPANAFVWGGNSFNTEALLGTNDNKPLSLIANAVYVMRLQPDSISPNIIGGSSYNSISTGVRGATIGGGGSASGADAFFTNSGPNRVLDTYGTVGGGLANTAGDGAGTLLDRSGATVAGGLHNTASGFGSFVGGGESNYATGHKATIAGGTSNLASSTYSSIGGGVENVADSEFARVAGGGHNAAHGFAASVGGGWLNSASGSYATVPGGLVNDAAGAYSVAVGHDARANHESSFVWNGWSGTQSAASFAANRFHIFGQGGLSIDYGQPRADGGGQAWVLIGNGVLGQAIATYTGGYLSIGGQWVDNSDVYRKTDFVPVDVRDVLARVARLPINRWRYIGEDADKRHIGPTAQDFWSAFRLGDDDRHIAAIDEAGVALAAIQGLHAELRDRDATIAELRRARASLKSVVTELVEAAGMGLNKP